MVTIFADVCLTLLAKHDVSRSAQGTLGPNGSRDAKQLRIHAQPDMGPHRSASRMIPGHQEAETREWSHPRHAVARDESGGKSLPSPFRGEVHVQFPLPLLNFVIRGVRVANFKNPFSLRAGQLQIFFFALQA